MSDLNASTSQETLTATKAEPVAANEPKLSPLEQIDQLLQGKKPDKSPEKAPEPASGGDPAAAQESESEADDAPETDSEADKTVDYTQQIPLSNGTKISLGELKDAYQAFDTKELALIERENKVMSQYRELQDLGQYLNLPPEAKARIQQEQSAHLQQQHALMLEAIPEWKDQAVFEKARGDIFQLGKEYGVDLSMVTDHAVVKMLNDFSRLKAAIKTAKATVKPVKSPEPKARQPHMRTNATDLSNAVDAAKRTGNVADQVKAVDLLLKG